MLGVASIGAAAAIILVVAVGFVDWNDGTFHTPEDTWWWYLLALAVVALIASLVGLMVAARSRWATTADPGGFASTLLGTAPFILALASALTVALYILPIDTEAHAWWKQWGHHGGLVVAVVVSMAVGVIFAYLNQDFTAPKKTNPRLYGEFRDRLSDLEARLAAYCPPTALPVADDAPSAPARSAACAAAHTHRDCIRADLGLPAGDDPMPLISTGGRWVLGTGFIDLWAHLHGAEEALFLVQPEVEVVGNAIYDEMRLKDSRINNSTDYIDKLRRAASLLGGAPYLAASPPPPQVNDADRTPATEAQARVVLRGVRHVINQYRDARREGLVRSRNHLMETGIITGAALFALLALAVLRGVDDTTIIAAVSFYLVGAVIGLFDQLRSGWGDETATEEDYGLTRARLLYTPLLSGLAGVAGVVITTMLYATLSGPMVTATQPSTPTPTATPTSAPITATAPGFADAAPAGTPAPPLTPTPTPTPAAAARETVPPPSSVNLVIPRLEDIFDLDQDRFGLVIAAVFGLTPSLLVDRLKKEADRYKADLQSTNARDNA